MAGLITEVCLCQSVLGALNDGYDVYFVSGNCSGGVTVESHEDAKARMIQAGAKAVSLWAVLSEWTPDYTSPERQKLVAVTRERGGVVTLMADYVFAQVEAGVVKAPEEARAVYPGGDDDAGGRGSMHSCWRCSRTIRAVPRSRGHRRPNPSGTRTAVARTTPDWAVVLFDRFGPLTFNEGSAMDVAPHPHTGLQTVTWLQQGELVHHDSLGSEGSLRPGAVNVMTSGHAIAHAERTPKSNTGRLGGVQLWTALPDRDRHGHASFQHVPEVPVIETSGGLAYVFAGTLGSATSPAIHFSPLVGADLQVHARHSLTIPVERTRTCGPDPERRLHPGGSKPWRPESSTTWARSERI